MQGPLENRRDRSNAAFFAVSLAVLLALAAGYVDTSDADASIETARALITRGSFRAEPAQPDFQYYAHTAGECCYSKMGWIHPILYAPVLALVKLSGLGELQKWRVESFFLSFVNPVVIALLMLLLFVSFRRHQNTRAAAVIVWATTLGSLLVVYSKTSHREPLQALLLTLVLLLVEEAGLLQSRGRLVALLLSVAALVLIKLSLIVALVPAGVFLIWRVAREKPRLLSAVAIGLAFIGLMLALINGMAFGQPLSGGYGTWVYRLDPRVWSTPFWRGIHEELFSLDSGFFIYNPWALGVLAFVSARAIRRRLTPFDLTLIATFLAQTLFYAKWFSPIGQEAIGPRYLVAVLPAVILLTREFRWPALSPSLRAGVAGLVVLSLAMTGLNTSVKMQQYWTIQARLKAKITAPHWWVNGFLLLHKIRGQPEIYQATDFNLPQGAEANLTDTPTLQGLNFWWTHLSRTLKGTDFLSGTLAKNRNDRS